MQPDVLHTNISIVFDEVNHDLLLHKLLLIGLNDSAVKCLYSYLSQRCLMIMFKYSINFTILMDSIVHVMIFAILKIDAKIIY